MGFVHKFVVWLRCPVLFFQHVLLHRGMSTQEHDGTTFRCDIHDFLFSRQCMIGRQPWNIMGGRSVVMCGVPLAFLSIGDLGFCFMCSPTWPSVVEFGSEIRMPVQSVRWSCGPVSVWCSFIHGQYMNK